MAKSQITTRHLIGVDEVGRGPLAGPVFVGAVIVPGNFDWKLVTGVRDSKKLTPRARQIWYKKISDMRKAGQLDFATASSSSRMIDRSGIVTSIRSALYKCLANLRAEPAMCEIRLDGGLHAPSLFRLQETVIHGDESEPIISMASIVAKVTRDSLMKRLALQFPEYGFEFHKGYGTARHRQAIWNFGLCELHRKSFCTKLIR